MVKFVYFDVGGVVIKDFSGTDNWSRLLEDLAIPESKRQEFDDLWKNFEGGLSIGDNIENILPVLKEKFSTVLPDGYSLLNDGFVRRFDRNPSINLVLDRISSKVDIGLLTNMYPGMLEAIKSSGLLPSANWKSVIDSSVVKLKKPDPAIFKLAQDKAGVQPEEILFVENTRKHIEAASAVGWQTFLYDSVHPEVAAEDLLERLILEIY